jgi:nucleotide-binding universal stress UspA family protein
MERLLVCIDGSKYSEEAVRHAVDIAKQYDSRISLIFVRTPPSSADQEMTIPNEIPDHELKRLNGAERILDEAGLKYRLIKAIGNPAEEILDESKAGYDLAILGSRGLGSVERFLIGSVTSRVSHHIKIPIMIVPPKK